MGERLRAFDWGSHPLGRPELWPQGLGMATSLCLNSSFPTAIYWGPDLYLLYNDANLKIQREGELCGTDRLPKVDDIKKKAQNKNVFSTCKDVEMMMSCDFEK